MSRWQNFKLVFKVFIGRVRFIAILVATMVLISYWESIKNHWHKETRTGGRIYAAGRSVLGERVAEWLWPDGNMAQNLRDDSEFYCPMHPSVVRPGLDPNGAVPKCPICGMPLSERRRGELPQLPDGVLSRKQFSPEQIQLAGIKTAPVTFQPLSKEIVTVGNVIYDESRLAEITSRVSGYLEKVYVNKTWISVNEGDPLAEIYSPELYASVRELLLVMERPNSRELLNGVREKLRLLGVRDSEIDEIAQSGKANHRLIIRSPQSGHIIAKAVKQGAHVEPGKTLFEVADLSAIWIEADVFERDISYLRIGQEIEATVEAFPNRVFRGKVSLVHPHLDPATRTNGVRFDVENPNHDLRPGMFATVRIKTPLSEIDPVLSNDGQVLAVPERAVVDTGAKKVVYVEREPGLFEGLEVELGSRSGDYYPVFKGLEPGVRIAVAGAFLLDAETRLNPSAGATYMGAAGFPQNARGSSTRPPVGGGRDAQAQPTTSTGPNQRAPAPSKRPSPDDWKNIAKLAAADRQVAFRQIVCPISDEPLGSMGTPYKMTIEGQTLFLCCRGCEQEARKDSKRTLAKIANKTADGEENDHAH